MSPDAVHVHLMIIPTVLIPLTAISVLLSSVAVFIAGLFGIKLKAEGPKKLLEVLLKPKVIIATIILNVVVYGGVRLFYYLYNSSLPDFYVEFRQDRLKSPSSNQYEDALMSFWGFAQSANTKTPNVKTPAKDKIEIEEVWNAKLPEGAFSPPVVSGGSVFVGSDDGYIYELSFGAGKILRKFFIGKEVSPSPLVYAGFLFAGEGVHDTHHARVSKFDLKTGKYLGSTRTVGHIEGQLAIDAGNSNIPAQLYASGGVGGLYALDPHSMNLNWRVDVGHSDSGARYEGDRVYFGTGREKSVVDKYRSWAVAVSRKDGSVLWKREMPASSWMQPIILSDRVCYVFGEIYFTSEIGGLGCFRKDDGATLGFLYHDAPVVADPLVRGDELYVTDVNGRVCRFSLKTLERGWCHSLQKVSKTYAGIRYLPVWNLLVQATRKEGVYFLNPETGDVVARWPKDVNVSKGSYAAPTIEAGDILFIEQGGEVLRLQVKPKGL